MAECEFENLNLHDSEVLGLCIDRRRESVHLDLDYIECYEPIRTARRVLRFIGCIRLSFQWHLICAPPESILDGEVLDSSPLLAQAEEIDRKVQIRRKQKLRHFRLLLNSGSSLDFLAEGVELVDRTD